MSLNLSTKWSDASTSSCLEQNPPDIDQRFKLTHNVENNQVKVSEHPWCVSCYALYIDVCKGVADAFDQSLPIDNKGEFKLYDLKQAILNTFQTVDNSYDPYFKFAALEQAIKSTLDCINARRYHHQNCYKRVVAVLGRGLQV